MDRDPTAHRYTPRRYYIGNRKQDQKARDLRACTETLALPASDSLKK